MPPNAGPLEVNARILPAPTLKYNPRGKNPNVVSTVVLVALLHLEPSNIDAKKWRLECKYHFSKDVHMHTGLPETLTYQMIEKKFYEPKTVDGWVVVIYENERRFGQAQAQEMVCILYSP